VTVLRPELLPALLVVPLALLALWRLDRARGRRLVRAIGPRVTALAGHAGAVRRRTRRLLLTVALLMALLAMLQPVWGKAARERDREGVDILVCLDVSRSMLARDVAPSRLERARREIGELAARAEGDRLGLVVFAGDARLAVPLTLDAESFAEMARLADPLSVDRGGTDLGAALATALDALLGQSGETETVLLLTDGEDHEEKGLRVAETARARNIAVHCVGFGSARGAKIPIETERGEVFLRDRGGADVISAMDPATLRRIAAATGGAFVDALAEPHALVDLYESRILPMARKSFAASEHPARESRYQWPLAAAFLIWIVNLCLVERKPR